jgi:hypothetical protein
MTRDVYLGVMVLALSSRLSPIALRRRERERRSGALELVRAGSCTCESACESVIVGCGRLR